LKKILLDTTYILPIFGIGIKIPNLKEKLLELEKNSQLLINSLSILEAKWKILKLAKKTPDIIDSFQEGLLFIEKRKIFHIVNFHEYSIDVIATELNRFHKDYIDCSILASAYIYADIFITEEKENMKKLIEKLPHEHTIHRKPETDLKIQSISELKPTAET